MRNLAKKIYIDTQVGGGQDKLAWTAYPPPLQLSIQNNLTKKTAEFDLNLYLLLIHPHIQIV